MYILTAAHCVKSRGISPPFRYQVILGDLDWKTRKETEEIRRAISKAVIHPKFQEKAPFDYDFALLKLSQPIDFHQSHLIRPVCLPEQNLDVKHLIGRTGTASGWGVVDPKDPSKQANKLQTIDVKVMNMTKCQYSYPTFPSLVTPSMLCASEDSADSCYGDSGGPFYCKNRNVFEFSGSFY